MNKSLHLLPILMLATSCTFAQVPEIAPKESPWKRVTALSEPALKEISGLAPSQHSERVLWSHNDGGGDPHLHALHLDGQLLGSVRIKDVNNKDWEDLCAFRVGKAPYLLIADTGDNKQKRPSVRCHAVPEPDPDALTASVAWTQTIRFEDGPQDCESVAVVGNRIFLLNKNIETSTIYEAPLGSPGKSTTVIARKLAVLPQMMNAVDSLAAVFKAGFLGSQATAMDVSSNNRWAAVLTYTDVRLFERQPDETWKTAFTRPPQVVALSQVFQPEALCFSSDSTAIYVSSEGTPAPIMRYQLKP